MDFEATSKERERTKKERQHSSQHRTYVGLVGGGNTRKKEKKRKRKGEMAERSKAVVSGTIPKGRGFESHSRQLVFFCFFFFFFFFFVCFFFFQKVFTQIG